MDPFDALKARKAKLLADVEALDADARELERLKALAEKYGFELTEKHQNGGANGVSAAPVTINIAGPVYRAAINVAENAIRAAGQPLEFREIYDACVSQHVPLGGKRPESTLSAYLSHSKSTVESVRKGVYWLKNVPIPQ